MGPPSPKLFDGMAIDHLHGRETESSDDFVTSNYGVCTSSKAEWYAAPTERRRALSARCWLLHGLCFAPRCSHGSHGSRMAHRLFVVDSDANPAQLSLDRWPEESIEKLPDRARARSAQPQIGFETTPVVPC